MARRLKAMGNQRYQRDGDPGTSGPGFGVAVHPGALTLPLTWRKPRRVFVNSMSDLFHAEVPTEYIAHVFAVMAAAPRHTFQILTKRHARMRSVLSDAKFPTMVEVTGHREKWGWPSGAEFPTRLAWPLPNVHLGVSAEDQRWADIRIPALLATPAAVRWISAEPLLGPLDLLDPYLIPGPGCPCETGAQECAPTLDWVVVGGESGPGARPMNLAWAEVIVGQCQSAGTPVLVKQLGSAHGPRDHHDIETFPVALRVREYPTTERTVP